MANSHALSLMKAVSWRLVGSVTTGGVIYLFTGNSSTAVTISGIEVVSKICLFYGHERLWHWLAANVRGAKRQLPVTVPDLNVPKDLIRV